MANPYRDKRGRFSSAGRAIMWIGGGAALAVAAGSAGPIGAAAAAAGIGVKTLAAAGAISGATSWAQASLVNYAGDTAGRAALAAYKKSSK